MFVPKCIISHRRRCHSIFKHKPQIQVFIESKSRCCAYQGRIQWERRRFLNNLYSCMYCIVVRNENIIINLLIIISLFVHFDSPSLTNTMQ